MRASRSIAFAGVFASIAIVAAHSSAAPTFGVEVRLEPAGEVDAEGSQLGQRVAPMGSDFIAVWNDGRQYQWIDSVGFPSILFSRLKADGTFLDPKGRRVPHDKFGGAPLVACATDVCLLVGNVAGAFGTAALRIDATGTLLDSAPIPLATDFAPTGMSWSGKTFLVTGFDAARAVRAVRVDVTGKVLDSSTILVDPGPMDESVVTAASGGVHGLAWARVDFTSGASDVRMKRVDDDGLVLDAAPIAVATTSDIERRPEIAATSDGWLIAYSAATTSFGATSPWLAHVTKAGVVDKRTSPALTGDWYDAPVVAWNGTVGLFVAASNAVRIGADGTTIGTPSAVLTGSIWRLAARPTGFLGAGGGSFATVSWLDTLGVPTKTARLARSAPPQRQPKIATSSEGSLVLWQEKHATGNVKYGRLGTLDDTPDGVGKPLAITGDPVSVHRAGTGWLAFARQGSLVAQRIAVDGSTSGPLLDFGRTGAETSTAVQGSTLIAATVLPPSLEGGIDSGTDKNVHVFAGKLDATGSVGPGDSLGLGTAPQVACSSCGCLLAYGTVSGVVARTVGVDGKVGVPFTVAPAATNLALAATGTRFTLVSTTGTTLEARTLQSDGSMIGAPITLSTTASVTGAQPSPELAFDGTDAMVAWYEGSLPSSLRVARVREGVLLDAPGLVAASVVAPNNSSFTSPFRPSIAGREGAFVVAYQTFSWLDSENAPRIRARSITNEASDAGAGDAAPGCMAVDAAFDSFLDDTSVADTDVDDVAIDSSTMDATVDDATTDGTVDDGSTSVDAAGVDAAASAAVTVGGGGCAVGPAPGRARLSDLLVLAFVVALRRRPGLRRRARR